MRPPQRILSVACLGLLASACAESGEPRIPDAGIQAAQTAPGLPTSVPDFALVDTEGRFHRLSEYADRAAVVLFVQGNGCPIVRHAVSTLRELRERYRARDVAFLFLNPQTQDTPEEIRSEAREFGMADFPILVDRTQLVARSLGVERTAEVLLIDPRAMEMRYRGPVDDRLHYGAQRDEATEHHLVEALDAFLAGEPIARPVLPAAGCAITYVSSSSASDAPSYGSDVVPILQHRCVPCHRPRGMAPWAMTGHAKLRGWAGMMREVVLTGRMPPGQVDPTFAERFADVPDLPPDELSTLVRWIDAGAPFDGGEDALRATVGPAPEWVLGEPDILLELPPQEIPATGLIDYVNLTLDAGNTEDVWIRALDFEPGDRQVLHHLLVYLRRPGEKEKPRGETTLLGGYGPGKSAQVLPPGTGRLLEAGGKLRVQIHYTSSGRATTDRTRIALYLHDQPPDYRLRTYRAVNPRFEIPPRAQDHPVDAWSAPFGEDVLVYSFTPHMHLRGKAMKYTAHFPDERPPQVLLSVPNFEFDWQMKYTLKQPIPLPQGARIHVEGAFDNSAMNRSNPDPDATVVWGQESWDEMFIGYFNVSSARPWREEGR